MMYSFLWASLLVIAAVIRRWRRCGLFSTDAAIRFYHLPRRLTRCWIGSDNSITFFTNLRQWHLSHCRAIRFWTHLTGSNLFSNDRATLLFFIEALPIVSPRRVVKVNLINILYCLNLPGFFGLRAAIERPSNITFFTAAYRSCSFDSLAWFWFGHYGVDVLCWVIFYGTGWDGKE